MRKDDRQEANKESKKGTVWLAAWLCPFPSLPFWSFVLPFYPSPPPFCVGPLKGHPLTSPPIPLPPLPPTYPHPAQPPNTPLDDVDGRAHEHQVVVCLQRRQEARHLLRREGARCAAAALGRQLSQIYCEGRVCFQKGAVSRKRGPNSSSTPSLHTYTPENTHPRTHKHLHPPTHPPAPAAPPRPPGPRPRPAPPPPAPAAS